MRWCSWPHTMLNGCEWWEGAVNVCKVVAGRDHGAGQHACQPMQPSWEPTFAVRSTLPCKTHLFCPWTWTSRVCAFPLKIAIWNGILYGLYSILYFKWLYFLFVFLRISPFNICRAKTRVLPKGLHWEPNSQLIDSLENLSLPRDRL